MPVHGHQCTLRRSTASNTLTTEATTLSAGNTVAQITDAAKRVLNRAVALSVVDNGGAVADSAFTVDYLYGKITKLSGAFTGPVTISGAYLTMTGEREPRAFSAQCSTELFDTTLLGDQDRARALAGLRTANGEISVLDDGTFEIGTGISAQLDFEAGTERVIELDMVANKFRAYVKLEELSRGVGFDGQLEVSFAWQSTAPRGTDQTVSSKSFGFGT